MQRLISFLSQSSKPSSSGSTPAPMLPSAGHPIVANTVLLFVHTLKYLIHHKKNLTAGMRERERVMTSDDVSSCLCLLDASGSGKLPALLYEFFTGKETKVEKVCHVLSTVLSSSIL
jgi:hypothetical protein